MEDYHSEMNGDVYEHWFNNFLLPNIPYNAVIVSDRAAYHMVQTSDSFGCNSTTKNGRALWLIEHEAKDEDNNLYTIEKLLETPTQYPGTNGTMTKFIHLGGVLIQDNVEIGSNTSIDRGTLGNTIIRKGVKIDNQVHIAHNCDIGEDVVVIAQSMVGGSVKIGNRSWIAPSVVIMNGITIGSDATCGLGAVITKSVKDGDTVMGNPARPFDEAKLLLAAQKKLIAN